MELEGYPQSEATASNDPTMREYVIRAKVKVVKQSWFQGLLGGKTEFKAALLIPEEGDSTTMFYSAWLPDAANEHFEIVMEFGHPVYGTCRAAVLRQGKFYQKPHIFIMSKGVEEILVKKDGMRIENIKILPAAFDDRADSAIDTNVEIAKFS